MNDPTELAAAVLFYCMALLLVCGSVAIIVSLFR